MNPGLAIFKRIQRLQGGTEEVPPWLKSGYDPNAAGAAEWVSPSGQQMHASPKEASGLYAPQEQSDADLAHLTPEEQVQEQIDWHENIKQLLAITPDLTPEERRQVLELNPKDWDDSTREKVGNASERAGTDMQLAQGTSNVNNPGLRLFYQTKKLRKPKP